MTDEKSKTKKAILGELESISSLLQLNEIDSNGDDSAIDDEPPLLTAMADDEIDFSDDFADSPLLTDALNSVIDAIEGRVDEDDIPTLADSIPAASELQTTDDEEPVFDDNVGLEIDSHEEPEDDIVSRALKSNLRAVVANLEHSEPKEDFPELQSSAIPDTAIPNMATPTVGSSSAEPLPELIIDEQDNSQDEELTNEEIKIETIALPATNSDLQTDTTIIDDIPSFGDVEPPTPKLEDLNVATEKNAPKKSRDDSKAQTDTLNAKQINSLREKTLDLDVLGKTEHQPSLFDKEVAPPPSASSQPATNKRSNQNSSIDKNLGIAYPTTPGESGSKKAINANNPFLPKHIRDRLHTSRTLQQEIDDSPYMQANNTPPSGQYMGESPATNNGTQNSTEEMLVDELVQSYIAKIEPELRTKIRKLIKKEKQEK